jgi:hypothetical protein
MGFGFSSESLTPLLCLNECGKLGYKIAGMEYGDEVGRIGGHTDGSATAATRITGEEARLTRIRRATFPVRATPIPTAVQRGLCLSTRTTRPDSHRVTRRCP